MNPRAIVFTKSHCPDCDTLKHMLTTTSSLHKVEFKNIDTDPVSLRFLQQSGVMSLPAVFVQNRVSSGLVNSIAALRSFGVRV